MSTYGENIHKTDKNGLIIKKAKTENDSRLIYSVEKICFEDPWSYESVSASVLHAHLYGKTSHSFVAISNVGECLGYVIAESFDGEGELLKIAVLPECRGLGIGELLICGMLDDMRKGEVKKLFLEVRESNLPAISLYKKHGFKETGLRKNYYRSPMENAKIFELDL